MRHAAGDSADDHHERRPPGSSGVTSASRLPVLAPPVAVGLLAFGIALKAATLGYDLTHWDLVYYVPPQEAANRNGLVDLANLINVQLAVVLFVHPGP
jgi:hypothetical protein